MTIPIRPLARSDLPQIAPLHVRARHGDVPFEGEPITEYLETILFENPLRDDSMPSLIYEEGGRILGFLGVIPRRMIFRGRPIMTAGSCLLTVAPEARGRALDLVRTFFSGPQELSISDRASDAARCILCALGGRMIPLGSIHWKLPLRPARHALDILHRKLGLSRALTLPIRPFCPIVDSFAAKKLQLPADREVCEEPVSGATIVGYMSQFSETRELQADYDERTMDWLLGLLSRQNAAGPPHLVVLRESQGEVAGWCLVGHGPKGISEILHMQAREFAVTNLINHVASHARRHGAFMLTGRLDPQVMPDLSKRPCHFRSGPSCMVVHAKSDELLQSLLRGDGLISRLDGEWWIEFPPYLR